RDGGGRPRPRVGRTVTAGVLCAVRGTGETVTVRALGSAGSRVEVTRRCADVAELLAAAAAGLGRVAVVSATLPGLDREVVRHLHGSQVWVVALADAREGWAVPRVQALGADAVLETADVETAVAGTVTDLLDRAERGDRPGDGAAVTSGVDPGRG